MCSLALAKVNEEYDRNTEVLTTVDVSNVLTSNIEFVKNEAINETIFSLARLDVSAYTRVNQARLLVLDKRLLSWYRDFDNLAYIQVLNHSKNVFDAINEAQRLSIILQVLSENTNTKRNSVDYSLIASEINQVLNEGYLVVISKDLESEKDDYVQLVKDLLAGYGANIIEQIPSQKPVVKPIQNPTEDDNKKRQVASTNQISSGEHIAKNAVQKTMLSIVEVQTSVQTRLDERNAHRTLISVVLSTHQNDIELGNNTLETRARSYQSEKDALKKAVQGLEVNLKNKSLAEVLGLAGTYF